MSLSIELRERTRTCWTLREDCPDNEFDLLDAFNRWNFGASMQDAGNWRFEMVENLSELPDDIREHAGDPEVRMIEVNEIGSILITVH